MKQPRRSPAKRSSRSNRRRARVLYASINTAATLKRTARKMKTEAWSSEFLTTTNVAPQRSEQKASDRSARLRRDILGAQENWRLSVMEFTREVGTRGEKEERA